MLGVENKTSREHQDQYRPSIVRERATREVCLGLRRREQSALGDFRSRFEGTLKGQNSCVEVCACNFVAGYKDCYECCKEDKEYAL